MHEAKIEETEHGRMPADGGWFIMNLRDVAWATVKGGGAWAAWETRDTASETLGWGVHILWPGDSPGYYHAESQQEGFLVLSGECIAIVEGEERRMGPGDFLHSPPGTAHITVGAGDGPCALVMVGTRAPNNEIQYLVWDSFSAARTQFFAEGILRYVSKYHGHVVHTEFISVSTPAGDETQKPVIVVYEVRP